MDCQMLENSIVFTTSIGWFKLNPKCLSKLNVIALFKDVFSNVIERTLLFSAISSVPYWHLTLLFAI